MGHIAVCSAPSKSISQEIEINPYLQLHTAFLSSLKMVVKHKVEGFEAFVAKAEELAAGKSWCPDCVVAEPVVDECLAACGDDVTFLYVGVGDRAFWKDPKCVFRTDERTKLRAVPTLVKWGTAKKLDDNCHKKDFVEMLLEDD